MKRLLVGLLGAAVLGGTAAAVASTASPSSAPAKPGLTLQVAPASQSIPRGQVATYTVTITPTGGFTGSLTLAATGLPSATSANFTPGRVTIASGAANSTLTVATTAATPIGSSAVTITGVSGKINGSVVAGLTVSKPIVSTIALAGVPGSVSVLPGSAAAYGLTLTRTNMTGPVAFWMLTKLPAGAVASFAPNPTTGNFEWLQVTTTSSTPTGSYPLNVMAFGAGANNSVVYAYLTVTLVVTKSGKPFGIAGNLAGSLAPGVALPLDLTLTNPNNQKLSISNLTVTIKSVAKAAGAPAGACSTSDYAVTQYSGPYPLAVAANGTTTISSLVSNQAKWPQVRMLNTSSNQNGCKGATVTLAYSGAGGGS
jgi:hypothetical protein